MRPAQHCVPPVAADNLRTIRMAPPIDVLIRFAVVSGLLCGVGPGR